MKTTQDRFKDFTIVKTLGPCAARFARHLGGHPCRPRSLIGGEITEYEDVGRSLRNADRMTAEAKRLGADAIVAVRWSRPRSSSAWQLAYGAVKLTTARSWLRTRQRA
jgi:uncharacterized protein YbjQ (UPF0145 family)